MNQFIEFSILGGKKYSKKKKKGNGSVVSGSSTSSRISSDYMFQVLENLKNKRNKESTNKVYLSVWRKFNQFLIRLDKRPKDWEDRVALFCAYLIEQKNQSSTVRSYISAIKAVLQNDGYIWDDKKVVLTTLTRACRLINDKVRTRLPIKAPLLELILFELGRFYDNQPYLTLMYRALFVLVYYGLLRIGELTTSEHVLKAKDIHVARNKQKILIVLHSSKTHTKGDKPQHIKIATVNSSESHKFVRHFCPFTWVRNYMITRGDFDSNEEQFFVFRDRSPGESTTGQISVMENSGEITARAYSL